MDSALPSEKAYFAAANTFDGFRSFYDRVYPSLKFSRVLVLKGGPGTGKSRLIRTVADEMKRRGADITYYYCSSDPTSLDGAVMTHAGCRLAILDGTAPHTRCAPFPGVIDEICNLGEFWNTEKLSESKAEILALGEEKARAFSEGYRYLRLAGGFHRELFALTENCLQNDKIEKHIARAFRPLHRNGYSEETVLVDAVGMRGRAHLPTVDNMARKTVNVGEKYAFSALYFAAAENLLRRDSIRYIRVASPLSPEECVGLYFPDDRILYRAASEKCESVILNPLRFFDKDRLRANRCALNRLKKGESEMTECAVSAFRSAGDAHFALEEHYIAAMDFTKKEEVTRSIVERFSALLFR